MNSKALPLALMALALIGITGFSGTAYPSNGEEVMDAPPVRVTVGSLESEFYLGQDVIVAALVENTTTSTVSVRIVASSVVPVDCLIERDIEIRQNTGARIFNRKLNLTSGESAVSYIHLLRGGWSEKCLELGVGTVFGCDVEVSGDGWRVARHVDVRVESPRSELGVFLLDRYRGREEPKMFISWYEIGNLVPEVLEDQRLLLRLLSESEYSSEFRLGPLNTASIDLWRKRLAQEARSGMGAVELSADADGIDAQGRVSARECALRKARSGHFAETQVEGTNALNIETVCGEGSSEAVRRFLRLLQVKPTKQ